MALLSKVGLFLLLMCNSVSAVEDGQIHQTMRFFTANGWSVSQAAGIVGNLMQESKLNPKATGKHCYGLAPWQGTRFKQLKYYAAGKGRSWTCGETQLSFILHELGNTESRAGARLKQATTVEQATTVVGRLYLRPKKVETVRYKYAYYALEFGGLK